ncbi:hypothetical protein BFAG_00989 [Bacteroides fragilis 3_1_12]|uniref:Transmembrane protein n=1 Tax=Bacteroides fragilis 3_1_12 TaxID=457424 RepID=A0ABN0BH97_BACFG|nr:hypothetical protein BFAG_00989 [Bacteroides fragilis 3_1_12]
MLLCVLGGEFRHTLFYLQAIRHTSLSVLLLTFKLTFFSIIFPRTFRLIICILPTEFQFTIFVIFTVTTMTFSFFNLRFSKHLPDKTPVIYFPEKEVH